MFSRGPGPWKSLLPKARNRVWEGHNRKALTRLSAGIQEKIDSGDLPLRAAVFARLYLSMIHWRLTGEFNTPAKNVTEARLQFWETEHHCPVLGYQKILVDHFAERFPNNPGFRRHRVVFNAMPDDAAHVREDRSEDVCTILTPGADKTIFGFSGLGNNCLGIGWTMFYRAAAQPANANLVILKDPYRKLYLNGLGSMGDRDATINALRKLVQKHARNTEVLFVGGSGGTFGALHIAPLITEVKRVVALSGPTSLEIGGENEDKQVYDKIWKEINENSLPYVDIVKLVKDSHLQRIDFFVAGRNEFDKAQMTHLHEGVDILVPHLYDTAHHSVTDLCIEDRRLIKVLMGEALPAKQLQGSAA